MSLQSELDDYRRSLPLPVDNRSAASDQRDRLVQRRKLELIDEYLQSYLEDETVRVGVLYSRSDFLSDR